jgi:hypothetical protein
MKPGHDYNMERSDTMSEGRKAVEEFLCDTDEKGLGFRVKV